MRKIRRCCLVRKSKPRLTGDAHSLNKTRIVQITILINIKPRFSCPEHAVKVSADARAVHGRATGATAQGNADAHSRHVEAGRRVDYEYERAGTANISGRRFADIPTLQRETSAWSTDVNSIQRGIDWQMKIADAHGKLKSVYPKIKTRHSTRALWQLIGRRQLALGTKPSRCCVR